MDSPLEPPKGAWPCQPLHFGRVKWISDFWLQELQENKILFVVICYSTHKKLIHKPLVIMIRADIKISIVPVLHMKKPSLCKSLKVTHQASGRPSTQPRTARFWSPRSYPLSVTVSISRYSGPGVRGLTIRHCSALPAYSSNIPARAQPGCWLPVRKPWGLHSPTVGTWYPSWKAMGPDSPSRKYSDRQNHWRVSLTFFSKKPLPKISIIALVIT